MYFFSSCNCCGYECPDTECNDSCSCALLTTPQPSIKVADISCESHCTGGNYLGTDLPGGTQTESIPYYASTNPTLIDGCCFTIWRLTEDNSKEQPCFAAGEPAPVPEIYVTIKCCPGVPEYSISYRYYHNPTLKNVGSPKQQKLCVVDGILTGCVILDLDGSGAGGIASRPNCQLRLIFGNAE